MDYKSIVNKYTPKEKRLNNCIIAFFSGGLIGVISQVIGSYFDVEVMMIVWITLASILTGAGVFDDLVDLFKMGLIIPITGFAHSVTSATLEYKKEGLITGIGSNYFKLAGSVILYGIMSATLFSVIRGIICLL